MNRHGNDLRERVIWEIRIWKSIKWTSEIFKVSRQTIYDWIELEKEWKLEEINNYKTRQSKLNYEEIKKYVEENPDLYNYEIAKHFGTSTENLRQILIKLNFTVKKNKRFTKKQMKTKEKNL